ncbi:MAG: hypothetical protein IT423_24590 [Pirellulaceae bacterium]|nr:hypothetical protein [Pirellulaceae bacterium]
MKSERRHELQTNYLADHLGTAVQSSKPYAVYAIAGVAAVAIAAIGYGIYSTQAAKASSAAWGDYYFNIGSGDAEVFQQVSQDHPGTAAANWSKQAWADNQLRQGLDTLYTNRKTAEESINSAIDAYQEVLKNSYEPDLKNRAAIGLAQAYESIGKLDEATRYYKQVASGSQDGFGTMANSRLAWLSSGDGKAFYDWFATVKPTPAAPPAMQGDLSTPPTSPDLVFPNKEPSAMAPLPNAPATTETTPAPGTAETTTPGVALPAVPTPGSAPAASDAPLPTGSVELKAAEPNVPAPATPAPATPAPATPAPATPAPATPAPASELQIESPAAPAADKPAEAAAPPAEAAPPTPEPPK